LVAMGERGCATILADLLLPPPAPHLEPIAESIPLWPSGSALEEARAAMNGPHDAEVRFRIAMSFADRGEDTAAIAIACARERSDRRWLTRRDVLRACERFGASRVHRALADCDHPHGYVMAVEYLLGREGEPEDREAIRAFLDRGTDRMRDL